MFGCPLLWLAASYQIGPGASYRILYDICYEGAENNADGKTENSNVYSVSARLTYNSPHDDRCERNQACVDNVPNWVLKIRIGTIEEDAADHTH